jgi:dynein heavy chain
MAFIKEWVDHGIPKVFWISGFFFPQAFLTGTMQNYARSERISIDTISFDFQILNNYEEMIRDPASKIQESPSKGVYIRGLYIEGARWDLKNHKLTESHPKELFTDMPVIYLIPEADRVPNKSGVYHCPVYKTLTRAGTLSTTGHSTNFVTNIEIPTERNQSIWIKQGVALLCALNY